MVVLLDEANDRTIQDYGLWKSHNPKSPTCSANPPALLRLAVAAEVTAVALQEQSLVMSTVDVAPQKARHRRPDIRWGK